MNPKPSASLTLLYNRLLQHDCISLDELQRRAQAPPNLDDEFHLFRRYPLVRISEQRLICIDMGFLMNKLETGVFWIIRNQLEDDNRQKQFFGLWGDVFEAYAASIIKRALTQTPSGVERCIISPKYDRKGAEECTDIAVCGDETLILLECKSVTLKAEVKFSGDFHKFYKGIKPGIIDPRGIKQLWNAIQFLGHTNKKERRKVKGIDISKVKRIYPVLVLSDHIFSFLYMNWFLNSEFQRLVKKNDLKKHLEVKPLTVLTTADLEQLEPYLKETPFYNHLDKWLVQFQNADHLSFSAYLRSPSAGMPRKNLFVKQQLCQIKTEILGYFSSQGIK